MVRARTDNPNQWFFGSRKCDGILLFNTEELMGRKTPARVACQRLPPSTVISTSAWVFLPSAFSLSIKGPALSLTTVTFVPVFC